MTKIIVPGEEVPLGVRNNHAFKGKDGKIYSTGIGLLKEEDKRLIPLSGTYLPRTGDMVIGIIKDVRHNSYNVYLGGPYEAYLNSRREYKQFDILSAKITEVNEVKSVSVGFERRLFGGELIKAESTKVARMIGKKGSMLALLQDTTGCELQVGKNGYIWAKGGDIKKLKLALDLIQKEAHLPGLTDKMKKFLEGGKPKKVEPKEETKIEKPKEEIKGEK